MCRISLTAATELRSCDGASSPMAKTISVSSDWPSVMRSPLASTRSVVRSPLTKVPKLDAQSRSRQTPSSVTISACLRETPALGTRTSASLRRPSVMSGLSIGMRRRPSVSVTTRRGALRR